MAESGEKTALTLKDRSQAIGEDGGDPVSFDPHNGSVLALKVWGPCGY